MGQRIQEIVFLTDLGDGCSRAIPAITRLIEESPARLTLLHAFDPRREARAAVEARLARFFPEADLLVPVRRLACEGDAVASALALAERRRVDLFLVPGSNGHRRFRVTPSLRATLLASCDVPVWTVHPRASVPAPTRRVAFCLDPESLDPTPLRLAARRARELSAGLHVLHAIPDFLDGERGSRAVPLHEDEVRAWAERHLPAGTPSFEVSVSRGGFGGALPELVRVCAPDLLVLGSGLAVRWGLWGPGLSPLIAGAPCPVLGVRPQEERQRSSDRGRRVPLRWGSLGPA